MCFSSSSTAKRFPSPKPAYTGEGYFLSAEKTIEKL